MKCISFHEINSSSQEIRKKLIWKFGIVYKGVTLVLAWKSFSKTKTIFYLLCTLNHEKLFKYFKNWQSIFLWLRYNVFLWLYFLLNIFELWLFALVFRINYLRFFVSECFVSVNYIIKLVFTHTIRNDIFFYWDEQANKKFTEYTKIGRTKLWIGSEEFCCI